MLMLAQPSDTMWFCVWTTKWQCYQLVCIIKVFNRFSLNISIILNMILPFYTLFLNWPLLYFPWSITSCLHDPLDRCFWNYMSKLTLYVWVTVWMTICVSYSFAPSSCKVEINWKIILFSMELRPSNTSIPCNGTLLKWSIVTEEVCEKIDIRYNALSHL